MRSRLPGLFLIGLLAGVAHAQTSPARGPMMPPSPTQAEIPLDDYLGLLEQIAPAARQGAQAYLEAFRQRCGHTLTADELRRAVADRDGDPVLMQMIRASYLDDAEALARLSAQVPCRGGGRS
ncbi:hypothetical protein [Xanthomonas hortorum]|uniref:Uncharacterized protein n=1 Tax=Xanthomonas hortorum pv. hederae TaxID=453603 RepID=A0A9X3YZB2_9XANT|nr:hypothetical protein [Xanthomonas hortorum]MCE4369664.1 hypothetical protein [Xanthomonas hortorum pv. hederae]MDC8637162.1 hypothetical protein [Xanthomonas hortorum pv. hederae]PPU86207.1 hypothetical protein XhhCFBP4925_00290 [Xanthomonas hortorum pv. hederae]PUF01270.1 hypothetical protein C7T87_04255 [Xanthomonas hortorum pv. hederae]